LAVRIAGLYDKNEGLGGKNIANGKDDEDETKSFRTSISFRPTERLDIDLTYQNLDNNTTATPILFTIDGATTDPVLKPEDRIGKSTLGNEYNYKGETTSLAASLDLDVVKLDYVGGYQDITQGRISDLAYGGSIKGYSQPQSYQSGTIRATHEFRLTSQGNDFWQYLFGAYYEDAKSATDLTQKQILPWGFIDSVNPPMDIAILDVGVGIPSHSQSYSFFTDQRFQLTENGQLQMGVRYQETDITRDFLQTVSGVILGPDPIVQHGISEANRDVNYSATTGSASYRYTFSSDLTGYLSWGRSYRPGGVVMSTAVLDEDLIVFDAETSDNFELGLKGTLFDGAAQFAVAIYEQDFKNYLAYTGSYLVVSTTKDGVVDNNAAFTFNADARVRGIEGTITAEVFDNFTMTSSVTYNDTQFLNSDAPCNDFNGDGIPDTTGAPSVPVGQNVSMCKLNGSTSDQARWSTSLNGEYVVAWMNGELFVRGLLNYIPERTDPFQNTNYSHQLNNSLFLGYRTDSYEVSLFGKNLGDSSTLTTKNAQQNDYNLFPTGYAVGTPVRPREFGLSVNMRF
jgi:iron complex outermembrane recepter protein